jgi:ketosteroid isomerase-like protein
MTGPDTDELLDAFFAAIERGDIDAVADFYDDDVAVWHNVTGNALDKQGSLALLRYWSRSVSAMRYEILERHAFDGGAVQRHVVHGVAGDDTIAAQVAIVFHIADGRITAIHEYLDPSQVAAVFDVDAAEPERSRRDESRDP